MPDVEEDLLQVVAKLRGVVPSHMQFHVDRIAHHASLIQSKAKSWDDDEAAPKAYTHNYAESKSAITSALRGLTDQLQAGHTHDVEALKTGKSDAVKTTNDAKTEGKSKTQGYRNKACPTKRKEAEADAKKKNAKTTMQDIAKGKICKPDLKTTFGDMDVDKDAPKYGTELRNAWDKARARYVEAKTAYELATKEHANALTAHNTAMASFKTALDVEAENANTACKNAAAEYATLITEVESNVGSRKEVYIATEVVKCYLADLDDNDAAKSCADIARTKDTSSWNIVPGKLAPCTSTAELTEEFGPKNWLPTAKTCPSEHWNKKDDVEFYATLYDN